MVEDEVAHLREIPYAVWREAVGIRRVKTLTGRDNKEYTATVTVEFERGTPDIRVTVTVGGPGLRRAPLQQAFVVSADHPQL
jgi:hypothetical protein